MDENLNPVNDKIELNKAYHSLAPTEKWQEEEEIEAKQVDYYLESFRWALEQEDIHNIALTGLYGSGKSSILLRVQKDQELRGSHKFLNISMASFQGSAAEKTNEEQTVHAETINDEADRIAHGILEQMLYHERSGNLPFSAYHKIPELSFGKFAVYVAWVYLIVFILLDFIFPETVQKFISYFFSNVFIWQSVINAVLFGFVIVSLYLFVVRVTWALVRKFRGAGLKISIGAESKAEVEPNHLGNVFDQNLDEILYFFEVTDYDTVIFEDIERFGNNEIFVQLRRLNDLLRRDEDIVWSKKFRLKRFFQKTQGLFQNRDEDAEENRDVNEKNSHRSRRGEKRPKRTIRFIYAVQDGLFEDDEERTKFFDFIIPVIPVTTNINSGDILLRKVKHCGLDKFLSDDFLIDISRQIHSMRRIHGIMNEFVLYYNIVFNDNLNPEKLFALIVYKNLRPTEFALMQEKRGIIASYLDEEGKNILLQEVMKQDNNDTRTERSELFSKSSRELLDLIPAFPTEGITANEETLYQDSLEYYMLRRGYIDESYTVYISYFYHEVLTTEDQAFVCAVGEYRQMDPAYHLENPERVLQKLTVKDFASCSFYNHQLVIFLIENEEMPSKDNYVLCRSTAFRKLYDNSDESRNFIYSLWSYLWDGSIAADDIDVSEKEYHRNAFIRVTVSNWESFWGFVFTKSVGIIDEHRKDIFVDMFRWASSDDILNQSNSLVKAYAEGMDDFADRMAEAPLTTIKTVTENLDIRYPCQKITEMNHVLQYIYKEGHYSLNPDTVRQLLLLYGGIGYKDIDERNYTSILNSPDWIKQQIRSNLSAYVDRVYLKIEENTHETEAAVLELCNAEDLSLEQKKEILGKEETLISDMSKIIPELWDYLLQNRKITITPANILTYYASKRYTSDLDYYLISCADEVIKVWESTYEGATEAMVAHVNSEKNAPNEQDNYTIRSHDIDDEGIGLWNGMILRGMSSESHADNKLYERYLNTVKGDKAAEQPKIVEVPNDRLVLLLNKKFILLTKENYQAAKRKANGPFKPHLRLLECWPDEYAKHAKTGGNTNPYSISDNDICDYLRSAIPVRLKLQYINARSIFRQHPTIEDYEALAEVVISAEANIEIGSKICDLISKSSCSPQTKAKVLTHVIRSDHLTKQTANMKLQLAGLTNVLKKLDERTGPSEIDDLKEALEELGF